MTEPTWTLPQTEVLLEGYRTRLSDEALAWLRKLKEQNEFLADCLEAAQCNGATLSEKARASLGRAIERAEQIATQTREIAKLKDQRERLRNLAECYVMVCPADHQAAVERVLAETAE